MDQSVESREQFILFMDAPAFYAIRIKCTEVIK